MILLVSGITHRTHFGCYGIRKHQSPQSERRVILVPAVDINNNTCHTQQAKQEKFFLNNIIITILRNNVRLRTLLLLHTCTLLITHYSTKFRYMVRLVIKFLIVIKCGV